MQQVCFTGLFSHLFSLEGLFYRALFGPFWDFVVAGTQRCTLLLATETFFLFPTCTYLCIVFLIFFFDFLHVHTYRLFFYRYVHIDF